MSKTGAYTEVLLAFFYISYRSHMRKHIYSYTNSSAKEIVEILLTINQIELFNVSALKI